MTPTSYVALGEKTSPKWCAAFARGCGGDICDSVQLRQGPVAMFGSPKLWQILMQSHAEGRTWYYGDHGYLRRGEYYRVTRNAYQHDGSGRAGHERFDALGVNISPWRTGGGHVLVCPPDEGFARLMRFSAADWLSHTLERLRGFTDRPLVVRARRLPGQLPLAADLRDCWALVTYESNAAVEAVLAGIPVFCTGPCAALAMGSSDLSQIEAPRTPEREQWAWNLAANQWTFYEMSHGRCWAAVCGQRRRA